ncbi:hypothetical protein DMJ13_10275 [halophilic archaeon]|nr:hypothetical protein DMJ13_10275 [halophilic archaeon]
MAEQRVGTEESGLPPEVVRALGVLKAGVVSTVVMMVVFVIASAQTRFNLGVPAAIAQFVGMPNRVTLGLVVFVAAGIVLWPLLFAAVQSSIPVEDVAVRGVLFALVLWVSFLLLGASGLHLSGAFVVLYIVFTLIAHVAYGYSLGVFYERFVG